MKSVGIVRKLDSLGRIVLPKELRRTFKIEISDPIEIFTEDFSIVLRKYTPACNFCGEASDVVSFKDKLICKNCLEELKKL